MFIYFFFLGTPTSPVLSPFLTSSHTMPTLSLSLSLSLALALLLAFALAHDPSSCTHESEANILTPKIKKDYGERVFEGLIVIEGKGKELEERGVVERREIGTENLLVTRTSAVLGFYDDGSDVCKGVLEREYAFQTASLHSGEWGGEG